MTARVADWRPEDPVFWQHTGRRIAQRNLWISVPALLLAFAVWMVWSVVVVKLRSVGFAFSEAQEFWLTALPALTGATLRIVYSFVVPVFGGRTWTAISTASLLLPCLGIGLAVQHPETPYGVFVALALLCGLGGANFASSMANINYFFPKERKGTALGLNAGLGNLGVSAMQWLVPAALGTAVFGDLGGAPQRVLAAAGGQPIWLQNAGFIWVPLVLLVTLAALWGMNDLAVAKASFRAQAVVLGHKHTWIMCWLYLGTFGSFIGYAAAFPKLIRATFPGVDPLQYAFLGPLVGALARPVGGWVADRLGGARVTLVNFAAMVAAVLAVLYFLAARSFPGFLTAFLALFVTTGIGNASTFRMIPVIFLNDRLRRVPAGSVAAAVEAAQDEARRSAARDAGAVLGFSSALGAYGGFLIPIAFGAAIGGGTPATALTQFLLFYLTCFAMTWWYYARRGAEAPC